MSEVNIKALTAIIEALRPLDSEERHRAVEAAMVFLGEEPKALATAERKADAMDADAGGSEEGYPARAKDWMKQHNISVEELDRLFHFAGDKTFDIHDVPGESKKDRTLNAYVLTGVGKYLATGERSFDDAMARGFCETLGCYDNANHSAHLKKYKGAEFSGSKSKGYSVTNAGLKRGAALVKELAGGRK